MTGARQVSPLALAQAWIDQAQEELSAHTGGRSVCQIHKDGQVTSELKYVEGRHDALRVIRRLVRQEAGAILSEGRLQKVVQEAAKWQRMVEGYRAKDPPPRQWLAYSQGGLDACLEYLRAVRGTTSSQ